MAHVRVANSLVIAGVLVLGSTACTLVNRGADPTLDELNFPVAVLAQGDDLLVINSNFNLAFNGAVIQRVSRSRLEDALRAHPDGIVPFPEVFSSPEQAAVIDSHASRSAFSLDGKYVYVPVQSDPNLTVLRLDEGGGLDCGQGQGGRCSDAFRIGLDPSANTRAVTFPANPVDVVVGDQASLGGTAGDEFVVVGHGGGRASLFVRERAGGDDLPAMVDVIDGLPSNLSATRISPFSGLVWATNASAADGGEIARMAVLLDDGAPLESFLLQVDSRRAIGPSRTADTRDIRFASMGGREVAFVLSRSPEAVWTVDLNASKTDLVVEQVLPVGFGAAELLEVEVEVLGETRRWLLVSCFNAREVYVLDTETGTVLSVIRGTPGSATQDRDSARFSGPSAMAFVPEIDVDGSTLPARLYVADFRASTIRIVDFSPLVSCLEGSLSDPALPSCEPTVIGTLGEPRPVGDLL